MRRTRAIVRAEPAGALSTEHADATARAREYAAAALAPSTRRAYAADWRLFRRWCGDHKAIAMPATPAVVAAFVADLASGHVPAGKPHRRASPAHRPRSIARYLAAIRYAHAGKGQPNPCDHPAVRAVLRGVRRTHGVAPAKKAPAAADVVARFVAAVPGGQTPRAVRDRAMILLGFAGALRRSEVVALDWEDIAPREGGLLVAIRRSKTDQQGRGRTVHVHRGARPELCPVAALDAWRAAMNDDVGWGHLPETGAVFRSLSPRTRGGRLGARGVAAAVKRAAAGAGLDPARYAGHSLRSGFATAAARAGKRLDAIRAQTGHRSLDMLAEYIADEVPWDDDAGKGLL